VGDEQNVESALGHLGGHGVGARRAHANASRRRSSPSR
jgi:hypothetical protein